MLPGPDAVLLIPEVILLEAEARMVFLSPPSNIFATGDPIPLSILLSPPYAIEFFMLNGAAVVALISKLDAAKPVVVTLAIIIAVKSNSFFMYFIPFKTHPNCKHKKIQIYLVKPESLYNSLYTFYFYVLKHEYYMNITFIIILLITNCKNTISAPYTLRNNFETTKIKLLHYRNIANIISLLFYHSKIIRHQ